MNTYTLILITKEEEFSKRIKKYFLEKGKIKKENIEFLCYGTDKNNKESIIAHFSNTRVAKSRNDEIKYVIFSDLGDAYKVAKQIHKEYKDKSYLSNSSIIESGYIVFLLLNSFAPFESVKYFLQKPTPKNEL